MMEVLLLEFKEILAKVQNNFYNYDLTDSIIENISFSDNLTDFKLVVDYYYTEKEEEHIILLFKNCTVVNYALEKEIYKLNNYELNFSQFTITKVIIEEVEDQICIKIFTVNDENEFLRIVCQDINFS